MELLPIGTIVDLKEGTKKLMVCGRKQIEVNSGKAYDYSACYYPEGMLSGDEMILFNNENIRRVYYVGMQDEEEFLYRKKWKEN